jgi:hypothetical protein
MENAPTPKSEAPSEPDNPKALFVFPANKAGIDPEVAYLKEDRGRLIEDVRSLNVDVFTVRGKASFDVANHQVNNLTSPEYGEDFKSVKIRQLGSASLDLFVLMKTHIVRLPEVESELPAFNPSVLRDLTSHKSRTIDEVLRPTDTLGREAISVKGDPLAINQLPGAKLVLKPETGRQAAGLNIADRLSIANDIASNKDEQYVVEEYLDLSTPMPDVQGDTPEAQAALDAANADGISKELRTFYYGPDERQDGVVRLHAERTAEDADQWATIDLDTIPPEVTQGNQRITAKIAEIIGRPDYHCAVDWVYAASASRPDPHWQVMEINSYPAQVKQAENAPVATRQRQKLAGLIARMAHAAHQAQNPAPPPTDNA